MLPDLSYNGGINGRAARVNMSKHGSVVKFHFKKQGANEGGGCYVFLTISYFDISRGHTYFNCC